MITNMSVVEPVFAVIDSLFDVRIVATLHALSNHRTNRPANGNVSATNFELQVLQRRVAGMLSHALTLQLNPKAIGPRT